MLKVEALRSLAESARAELESVADAAGLEAFRIAYLGRKGQLPKLMAQLGGVPPEQKSAVGKAANEAKSTISAAYEARKAQLAAKGTPTGERFDPTLPGAARVVGRPHVITQTLRELLAIFGRMGFEVAYGPEVEDEYHNFIALNTPPEHPARDPLDNFYITDTTLLRPQTTTVQVRVLETRQPPVRAVMPGRTYRPDTVDATHHFMFHQIDSIYVDEGVSMVDLKSCVALFCRAYFGEQTQIRFRPSYFPFTEPSAEVDITCFLCQGKGCNTCGNGWIELGGCGMTDPAVFEAVGYDPERYTGFAFGFGIERLTMAKYGITDIRYFFENDLRFLSQF